MPGAFPYRPFKDYVLIDGGSVWNINLASGIQKCMSEGATEDEITLDSINLSYI
jgi:hypothetical protein